MKKLCVLALVFFVGGAAQEDAAKKDLAALQGKWTIAALEVNGKDVPTNRLDGSVLNVKGSNYVVSIKDKKHGMVIILDPAKDPKEMDMVPVDGANKDKPLKAIYKLEKDLLVISRGLNPEHVRPREFATWPDTGYFVIKWKKQP